MRLEELEAFYTVEYPKLVKILVLLDATIAEAEDAVQKAMTDFVRRSRTAGYSLVRRNRDSNKKIKSF